MHGLNFKLKARDLKNGYVIRTGGRSIQWAKNCYIVDAFRETPQYFNSLKEARKYCKNN